MRRNSNKHLTDVIQRAAAALPPEVRKLLEQPGGVNDQRVLAAVNNLPEPIQKELRAAFAGIGRKGRGALHELGSAVHGGTTIARIVSEHPRALASLAGRTLVEHHLKIANRGESSVRQLFESLVAGRTLHPLLYALVESGDLARLARCANPNCPNFFLRRRKDARCCCQPCANALDQRRWRERYADQYKINRYKKIESRRENAV